MQILRRTKQCSRTIVHSAHFWHFGMFSWFWEYSDHVCQFWNVPCCYWRVQSKSVVYSSHPLSIPEYWDEVVLEFRFHPGWLTVSPFSDFSDRLLCWETQRSIQQKEWITVWFSGGEWNWSDDHSNNMVAFSLTIENPAGNSVEWQTQFGSSSYYLGKPAEWAFGKFSLADNLKDTVWESLRRAYTPYNAVTWTSRRGMSSEHCSRKRDSETQAGAS